MICPIHGVEMKKYSKERDGEIQVWYSHRLEDGTWCNGKEKKSGSGSKTGAKGDDRAIRAKVLELAFRYHGDDSVHTTLMAFQNYVMQGDDSGVRFLNEDPGPDEPEPDYE